MADQIIEQGPWSGETFTVHCTPAEINELRDELIAGRQARTPTIHTTYRTEHGVSIIREGKVYPQWAGSEPQEAEPDEDELVAVVVNGEEGLAERICALLNPHTADVDYLRGAREAIAQVERRLAGYSGEMIRRSAVDRALREAAAEIGVDA